MTENFGSATTKSELSRYSWAEHLIWMEGGEPAEPRGAESVWSGLFLAVGIAIAAFALAMLADRANSSIASLLDPVLISMLLALVIGNVISGERLLPGLSFAVRRLLPIGIVLLGARMHLGEALEVGVSGILMSIFVVLFSILVMIALGRAMKLDRELSFLLGVGTGICGGTAIVAIAPLISARNRNVIVAVGLVTLIGLGTMIFLPVVARVFSLTEHHFGLLAGLTIHQTPQVIAAGFAYGEEAGQVATVTKLARVCLLAPVALFMGWWVARGGFSSSVSGKSGTSRPWYRFLPGFALGFLLLAAVRSLGWLPDFALQWNRGAVENAPVSWIDSALLLKEGAAWLLAIGMAGVGFQTRLSHAREIGWRPIAMAAVVTFVLALLVLIVIGISTTLTT